MNFLLNIPEVSHAAMIKHFLSVTRTSVAEIRQFRIDIKRMFVIFMHFGCVCANARLIRDGRLENQKEKKRFLMNLDSYSGIRLSFVEKRVHACKYSSMSLSRPSSRKLLRGNLKNYLWIVRYIYKLQYSWRVRFLTPGEVQKLFTVWKKKRFLNRNYYRTTCTVINQWHIHSLIYESQPKMRWTLSLLSYEYQPASLNTHRHTHLWFMYSFK